MKKIKRIKDIQQEKMRLRIQQLEQEKALRNQWNGLKEELRPGTLLRNKVAEFTKTKPEEGHLISGLISYGAYYLTRRYTGMASSKIESTVQQGVDLLTEKMKTIFSKKK